MYIICFGQMSGAATSDQRAAWSSKSKFILNQAQASFHSLCQEDRQHCVDPILKICIRVQSYWKKKSLIT